MKNNTAAPMYMDGGTRMAWLISPTKNHHSRKKSLNQAMALTRIDPPLLTETDPLVNVM